MESLVEAYRGKRVLVTGHTGFKGSWLAYWLHRMGAEVYGISRKPHTVPSHYKMLLKGVLRNREHHFDIRDFNLLRETFISFQPEVVFHLAANAIVARTFGEPRETFESNVMGAVNLLEACRLTPSVKAVVMITTDKVYANREWRWAYRENDELGGLDPYSASKVCVEHVIECYRSQFFPGIATARAGNVIGGGDWAEKRLIPDIVRATVESRAVEIHTPYATRPWQHVLEPLYGYLLLGKRLMEGNVSPMLEFNTELLSDPIPTDCWPNKIFWTKNAPAVSYIPAQQFNKAWNFGPDGEMTVLDVLKVAKSAWPKIEYVVKEKETHPSMVQLLKIDSTESRTKLGWRPRWDMETAIHKSIEWYRQYYENGIVMTDKQIDEYEEGL